MTSQFRYLVPWHHIRGWCYKAFLEEIQISPKLRNWKMFAVISEPALKCENNAIFKQSYTMKLLIAFKMTWSCCFGWRGNLDFPDFLQKFFITSTTGQQKPKSLPLLSLCLNAIPFLKYLVPQESAVSSVGCINAEIENFLYLCGNATVYCRIRTSVNET